MIKRGVDVSAHQGMINWDLAKSQLEAVIIRAGYGKNNIDQKWVPNIETVRDTGLDVGVYWFSYAYSADMAYMEGKYAALAVQKKLGSRCIPIAYDLEYDSVTYAAKKGVKIDRSAATQYAIAFLTAVRESGYRPMLYTNIDYLKRYFDWSAIVKAVPDTMLWLAQWREAKPTDAYGQIMSVWQYSSDGAVPGIVTRVDMDIVYDDLEVLDPAAGPAEPAPAPEPKPEQKTVTAHILNIRKDPDVGSADLGDLKEGSIITPDEIRGEWAHISGWVNVKYLK
jgi:GH25 family lysozyme M1 (1,4-beta-N-acetylmuramidase)